MIIYASKLGCDIASALKGTIMTFQKQEPDVNKTATLTVRNIPLDVDAMITVQASIAGKSKSDFLKELLTQEFQDFDKKLQPYKSAFQPDG